MLKQIGIKSLYACVAQLVEHVIRNHAVGGSIPPTSSKRKIQSLFSAMHETCIAFFLRLIFRFWHQTKTFCYSKCFMPTSLRLPVFALIFNAAYFYGCFFMQKHSLFLRLVFRFWHQNHIDRQ